MRKSHGKRTHMAHHDTRPRTQAELDAYIDSLGRPRRNTFNGMFPLHEDMELDDEQLRIVRDYLSEVDFHLPGAAPDEFLVVRWARYTGFQFINEPLEAYAVGLRCTHPGMEDQHTFIRVSWAQLMGRPDAERLPINEPVLASDMMTLARYRDTRTGPSSTGVDSYAGDDVPGVDFDLALLGGALQDVLSQQASGKGRDIDTWWTPALNWGAAMAGRYPRLKYFESKGRLGEKHLAGLHDFERHAEQAESVLRELGLVLPERIAQDTLKQAAKAEKGSFLPRLRIRNPRPLTEIDQDDAATDDQRPYIDPRSDADFPTADDPAEVSSTDRR